MNKICLYIIIAFLFLISFVNAGVVFPIPDLELRPGESGRFQYAIQIGIPPQKCTISLDHKTPLIVEMDDKETIIQSTSQILYGSVKVPQDLRYGDYIENFCVSCEPLSESGGSSIRQSFCEIPIKVDVVGERTKQNIQFPEKPKEGVDPVAIVGVIVLIVLIVILILFSVKRPKNTKKRKI